MLFNELIAIFAMLGSFSMLPFLVSCLKPIWRPLRGPGQSPMPGYFTDPDYYNRYIRCKCYKCDKCDKTDFYRDCLISARTSRISS